MNHDASSDEGLIEHMCRALTNLSERQDLIEKAMEGYRGWFRSPEGIELGGFTLSPDDLTVVFRSCTLAFRWGEDALAAHYAYISTNLDLYLDHVRVGYYRLITLPSGKVDDDYFVFHDEFQEDGRKYQEVHELMRKRGSSQRSPEPE